MLDTNHYKNSSCAFAEQIVTYLYDEANSQEKTDFEAHLANCENCADELAGFGAVRFSVRDWRTREFSNLATPAFAIPRTDSPETVADTAEKSSWLADLRRLLTFSPASSAASAAFLIAAMVAGAFFVTRSFNGANDVADAAVEPQKSVAVPTIERKPEQLQELIATETAPVQVTEPLEAKVKVENTPPALQNSPAKIVNTPRRVAKSEMVAQNVNKIVPPRKVTGLSTGNNLIEAKNQQTPRLTEFKEVKDDSLRLADLIAEVEK